MKPENRFLNRLKPKVESQLSWYVEKTNNPYRSGTPDWYVEWFGGMGWIEAKFWDIKTEGKVSVPVQPILDKCTVLQMRWLERCADNENPVAVLCGFPDTKHAALVPIPTTETEVLVVTIPELLSQLQQWATLT